MLPHYDFAPFRVIADIGGGRGHLLQAVLDRTPSATGILFDQPHVLAGVEASPRVTVHPGDFLTDRIPPADCYLMSNIIHDWADAEATAILTAVRAAAPANARLLLFEFVLPEDAGPFAASHIDVFMLALVSGRERTEAEYARLLAASGFDLVRSIPTPGQTILEATPR